MKYVLQGVTATERYLTVWFQVDGGGWLRFGHVRVPLTELLAEPITSAMDRAVRRKLIEAWSEVDICDPLF